MLEEEKKRGREIARMSSKQRSELVAKMMFGKKADTAKLPFVFLMTISGIGPFGSGFLNNLYIGLFFTKRRYRDAMKLKLPYRL